eukprot:13901413-Heterocapsa_arctica.AAC.1
MEVDQEGIEEVDQGDDPGTEQENLDYLNQQQYDAAPEGGWNHDAVEPVQTRGNPLLLDVIDLEVPFIIREEIVNLRHRALRVAATASGADNVRDEYRVFKILGRIQDVMLIASSMEPPLHGESDGQVADAENLKRRWMACIRWYLGVSSVEQLQWEVSLCEEVFPRAVDPQEELDE